MAQYNYRCPSCNRLFATNEAGDRSPCPSCQGPAVRQFAFYVSGGLKEHWNNAVGQYVSNEHQMNEALKRQSEEMSVRTGMDHNYQYVDPSEMRDASAHGVSEDNLETTRQVRHDAGLA